MFIFFYIFQYLILLLIVFYIIFMLYVKIKHNFWAIQPVYHSYDWYYWFRLPFVIQPNHCGKKYVNFTNTQYYSLGALTEKDNEIVCDNFIKHIQRHYLREKEASYIPNKTHILSHFKPGNSVFILYYLETALVGSITSRQVNAFINGEHYRTFYVDYLCVHNDYRKKGVAPELIETLSYYQRKYHKNVDVSLFKKESTAVSHWIKNLVSYNTYFYEIDKWDLTSYREPVVRNGTVLVHITHENARLWLDFLRQEREKLIGDKRKNGRKNGSKIKCFIQSDDDVLLSQINKGVYMVYLLVQNGTNIPVASYIFKDSGTKYKLSSGANTIGIEANTIGIEVQSCFKIPECDDDTFVDGFYHALYKIQKISEEIVRENKEKTTTPKYQMMLFENISENNVIRNNFLFNRKFCCGKMPSTFYFYNYASKSVKPGEIIIIL